ncbi:MAG: pentapeptide repeat-containing protein [Chloroflexi bacterium]|nr:pentapeptide repeat-containing protein [Chloroflexota bacterium]
MGEGTGQPPPCEPPRTREAVDCWLRHWGRHAQADGTEPLTREDVERLIEANGGTAQGLNLNGRNMRGIYLEHAVLVGADLSGADMSDAVLRFADLSDAKLVRTNLRRADLFRVTLSSDTDLDRVDWGDYTTPQESERHYLNAISIYKQLRAWHQAHAYSEEAGEFHYREQVCLRKMALGDLLLLTCRRRPILRRCLRWLRRRPAWMQHVAGFLFPQIGVLFFGLASFELCPGRRRLEERRGPWCANLGAVARLNFYEQLFGYGERPWRVVRAAAAVIGGFAAAYFPYLPFTHLELSWSGMKTLWQLLWKALYFSGVSFTSLGYGGWVETLRIAPMGWTRYLGAVESLLGVFLVALFLVTFTRKIGR